MTMLKKSALALLALIMLQPSAQATNWKKLSLFTAAAVTASLLVKKAWCTSHNDHIQARPQFSEPQANQFPENFLWGAATSSHQVEGRSDLGRNAWHEAEKKHIEAQTKDENGNPLIAHPSNNACEHYDRCFADIELLKQAHLTSYRFSIAWEKVQPTAHEFNEDVLNHYADFCAALINNGITPIITLHHYADPIWFAQRGSFLNEANAHKFYLYAHKTILHILTKIKVTCAPEQLNAHRPLWFTFNSPSGYVSKCYLQGVIMPYETGNLQHMAAALKNMVDTHVNLYHAIKGTKFKDEARIGIMHNTYQLDPLRPWNPIDNLCCTIGNSLVHDCILNFFTTGKFSVWIPTKVSVSHTNPDAIGALDFIGLNYYSHTFMQGSKRIDDESLAKTNNANYRVYPEGLYRAIEELSNRVARPLNIPIYVTENGIGTDDNNQREQFFKDYLSELARAIDDGHDVRGYIHWSLMDNYEWGTYSKKYGMYAVNRETQERTLKPGAQWYVNLIQAHQKLPGKSAHTVAQVAH